MIISLGAGVPWWQVCVQVYRDDKSWVQVYRGSRFDSLALWLFLQVFSRINLYSGGNINNVIHCDELKIGYLPGIIVRWWWYLTGWENCSMKNQEMSNEYPNRLSPIFLFFVCEEISFKQKEPKRNRNFTCEDLPVILTISEYCRLGMKQSNVYCAFTIGNPWCPLLYVHQ
jgi:hypothetical protein